MAHLLRIVMIHGHLEGVVELDVDGHTNICGTNASGKTTLQRLVPVFYGELPNKVVPKTRMKFDAFYLPHRNSYLIYEYRREAGNVCQAVLTRKKEGGLEYRFVGAPYRPEDYLVESDDGVVALDYSDWVSGLRRAGISVSSKLGATSEYRSVIQNDFTQQQGNRREALKLRQIAAQFSLVKPERRIRHMEKLISAVHAKEGKMDTLKTMLAAIFEEDGVELPVTRIRNTKAREWIAQMRQSMRLEPLQRSLTRLEEVDRDIADLESTLWQLKPQLDADRHRAERVLADTEAELNTQQEAFQARESDYEQARDTLNDRISELASELDRTQRSLNDLQQQYEQYAEADMPALERDLAELPQWRGQVQELQQHLALMQDAAQQNQSRLDGRLRELADNLSRRSDEIQGLIDELGDEKAARQEQQWASERELDAQYHMQRAELDASYQERLEQGIERLADLKAQLASTGQSAEEAQEAELAQARVDQAQSERNAAAGRLEGLRREHETLRRERDTAEQAREQARQQLTRTEQRCQELQRQRDPAEGSLRHFMRYHRPGWEQQLGKVIAPELLERRDLSPQLADTDHDDLFGVALDLAAIELPDHARDEASLSAAIEAAEVEQARAEADLQAAEKQLKACHERVQGAEETLGQARIALKRADDEVEYALDARHQCQERHARQQKERRRAAEEALESQQAADKALRDEKRAALSTLDDTHQAQLLELKADGQSQLASFDARIDQHKQQLEDLKAEHRRQRKELEAAFDQELQEQGVDPQTLRSTRQRIADLEQRIRSTESRREELDAYSRFMRVEWGERKPQLVDREATLTRDKQAAQHEREQCRSDFQAAKVAHQDAVKTLKARRDGEREVIEALKPLLSQVEGLGLNAASQPLNEAPGDVHERIERTRQALSSRARELESLRKGCEQVEGDLIKGASQGFVETLDAERAKLANDGSEQGVNPRHQLPLLRGMLQLLEDQQQQLIQQGRNLGADLDKFFTVFRDLNRRISAQSRRLSEEVADDLRLDGIGKAEVRIQSTIDELGFWEPLKLFAQRYHEWENSSQELPSDDYLDALADVVDLLRHDQQYSFESLLRLELHLNEGGTDLVIKNDRQLLESSSHGMAYLILCKFLLAFTRLLRGPSEIAIHWPIDEIGTLAYHNVETLFEACDSNRIHIVGAFPNPESDVLLLFHNRYLIDRDAEQPNRRRLKRIEPRLSRLAERLQERTTEEAPA
ncbi:ATP-binding protein [Halomonas eurihalina]|uniref:ATP-binding protein n=1 Tax=Halomonas eurihalina TaxID=42566 RepID=A0A5D9CJW8_HALER|nr:ATP-binding protein [Halomonas eurihalina]MDR5858455.1 ATP-binding protein [Halomonas eurihalina]TZG31667.1 ATP-binding protein [Halomonas eurihalina]